MASEATRPPIMTRFANGQKPTAVNPLWCAEPIRQTPAVFCGLTSLEVPEKTSWNTSSGMTGSKDSIKRI